MTQNEPIDLPSAATAMRYAVALASSVTSGSLELERARTWVVIARELRVGSRPVAPAGGRDSSERRLDQRIEDNPAEVTQVTPIYEQASETLGTTQAIHVPLGAPRVICHCEGRDGQGWAGAEHVFGTEGCVAEG